MLTYLQSVGLGILVLAILVRLLVVPCRSSPGLVLPGR
jgi:hypothetical protein